MSTASYSSQPHQAPVARPDAKVKLTCVGDGGVGKTCLLIVYSQKRFPTDYIPTVFENYVLNKPYGDKIVEFALWDTAGQEEYDRLRPLSYPETHVLFICFAVDVPASLENVEDKWYPEVSHFCPDTPIVLIATKTDLRTDERALGLLRAQGRYPITRDEGAAAAARIGARYAEVSAISGLGVEEVFDLALREAMKGSSLVGRTRARGKRAKCSLL
ncbi:RHO4 protein [Rhodotorula kratochvilovae]